MSQSHIHVYIMNWCDILPVPGCFECRRHRPAFWTSLFIRSFPRSAEGSKIIKFYRVQRQKYWVQLNGTQ